MLNRVKLALRVSGADFDQEINDLISAAYQDLTIAGITVDTKDPLIIRAVITYCKANFGDNDSYDRLKASYDEQKSTLMMTTGYGFGAQTELESEG